MKIAIPSIGESLTSMVSDTLGRAPFIIFYDSSNEKYNSLKNPGFKIQDGSGLKVSEIILGESADVLLTREIGRKSYSALMKRHVKIHLLKSSGTVISSINKYLKKQKVIN